MLLWERRCENRRESMQFPLLFLSESLSVHFSTGSPSLWLGYHPRLSIVRLRRRRGVLCVAVGAEVGEQERVYTVSTFILVRVSLDAFSATPPASEVRTVVCPLLHGFPLALARVSPAVKHGSPPPEAWAALCYCGSGKDVVSESSYKTIYDMRGWRSAI